ncbi:hypothetical protein N8290_01920 [Pseudomonadales bacterium]|nr:hypothetical protein [Pseudomonadales bacterium]MDC1368294.1 hypothetical protein [Pseudomonadales bacterium]
METGNSSINRLDPVQCRQKFRWLLDMRHEKMISVDQLIDRRDTGMKTGG